MERYIAPYSFAVTDCHLRGDFCWYPGALGAPPNAPLCDSSCSPHRFENVFGEMDYPMDEYTLTQSFEDPKIAEDWLNAHFEYFVKKDDLIQLAESNLTHVRVPLAHWIFIEDPPYIAGKRWEYFQRLLQWCDELKLEVWPDIHTAPGSQNGFDNSGRQYALPTCRGWAGDPENVKKSLQVIEDLANAIKATEFSHVVTGFGLLNEPFKDCPRKTYLDFINKGLAWFVPFWEHMCMSTFPTYSRRNPSTMGTFGSMKIELTWIHTIIMYLPNTPVHYLLGNTLPSLVKLSIMRANPTAAVPPAALWTKTIRFLP